MAGVRCRRAISPRGFLATFVRVTCSTSAGVETEVRNEWSLVPKTGVYP